MLRSRLYVFSSPTHGSFFSRASPRRQLLDEPVGSAISRSASLMTDSDGSLRSAPRAAGEGLDVGLVRREHRDERSARRFLPSGRAPDGFSTSVDSARRPARREDTRAWAMATSRRVRASRSASGSVPHRAVAGGRVQVARQRRARLASPSCLRPFGCGRGVPSPCSGPCSRLARLRVGHASPPQRQSRRLRAAGNTPSRFSRLRASWRQSPWYGGKPIPTSFNTRCRGERRKSPRSSRCPSPSA
jgi:hypothetical protein